MQWLKRISTILAMAGLCLCLPRAYALAISDIQLNSHLNQRLQATVDLLAVSPEELDSLVVIIRPLQESSSAAMTWPKISHEIVSDPSGRHRINLSSPEPIQEPVLNFVLELSWSGGRLEREYVLLIDPDTE